VPVQSITYLSTLTLSLSPVAFWTLHAKDYVSKARDGLGRDSSVGIATRYRLDGPGIEFRWGRNFPHPSIPTLEHTQPPIQWVLCFFPGGKAIDTI
jgi:hypothetical protein